MKHIKQGLEALGLIGIVALMGLATSCGDKEEAPDPVEEAGDKIDEVDPPK